MKRMILEDIQFNRFFFQMCRVFGIWPATIPIRLSAVHEIWLINLSNNTCKCTWDCVNEILVVILMENICLMYVGFPIFNILWCWHPILTKRKPVHFTLIHSLLFVKINFNFRASVCVLLQARQKVHQLVSKYRVYIIYSGPIVTKHHWHSLM